MGAPYIDFSGIDLGLIETPKQPAQPVIPAFQGLRDINAQIQYDKDGKPIRNPYTSMTDANGLLLDQYRMANKIGADVSLDGRAINEIRNRALNNGPSAWANFARQKQQLDETNQIENQDKMSQGLLNQSFSNLAAKGGLTDGQRERLSSQNMRNNLLSKQNILNQGMQSRLGIDMQDQQTKDQFLSQLPNAELGQANFQQQQRAYRNNFLNQDIGNAMKDVAGYNAYNADAYAKAMSEWGAAKTADAQAKHSGGGGKK